MPSRSGFATLFGAPNVGKSTLFNRLVGTRLSIVTPKPQTTRLRIRGVVVEETPEGDSSEIVVVDVPGVFAPRRRLDRAMVDAAWAAAAEAEAVLLIADAARPALTEFDALASRLRRRAKLVILVINKIDLVPHATLLPLIARLDACGPFHATFLVSAKSGDGVADLVRVLAPLMPPGPHLYPDGQLSDLSERTFASEIVRAQIFQQGRAEIPYDAAVETCSWEEHEDGSVRVGATIFVAKPGQKAIVLGAGGARIREIGMHARACLAKELGRPVHLVLRVEIAKRWADDRRRLRRLGVETGD